MKEIDTPISKNNCFDLLRLILASLVLYTHAYIVGNFGESVFLQHTRSQMPLGHIAVLGFFGISGFLVSGSFVRSKSFYVYFKKRIARVFPAFWVCIIVSAFIFAPLISYFGTGSLENFNFSGPQSALTYFKSNFLLSINQWSVGNVLSNSPYKESLNGSLWSLYPEFRCYILTYLLGLALCLSKGRIMLLFFFVYFFIVHSLVLISEDLAKQFGPHIFVLDSHREVYLAFLTGMLLYSYRDRLPPALPASIFCSLCTALLLLNGGFLIAAPFIIPCLMINLGFAFNVKLKNDYSYGIYIYGFAVQQLLICFNATRESVLLYFILSLIFSVLLGILSWHLVEKPVLERTKKVDKK